MNVNRNLLAKRILFPWCLVAVSSMALVQPAMAAPLYNIVPLGFDDPEHTFSDGYKSSYALQLNEAGQVIGRSQRRNGIGPYLGQSFSAWLYNGASTINIGLTGPEHTRSNGDKYSIPEVLNEAGQVSGLSERYNGGSIYLGYSAWLYNGAATIDIGLTGPEYTRSDGRKFSRASDLNEVGQVIGGSIRYNGGDVLNYELGYGYIAWLYDGATTIVIGLTGPEHTRSDDYKASGAHELNEAGQVSGYSSRFHDSRIYSNPGRSAWLYNGTSTIELGFTGPEYTRNDGYKYSESYSLTETGQVIGYSNRYNGSTDFGSGAWLYDGATTIELGLTGPEYTRNDGYKYSAAEALNEAGQVSGTSSRYNGGSTYLGVSAWLYKGATTIDVGLTGPEHTRNDGYKRSLYSFGGLNEAGQVTGYSGRYNGGSTDLGQSAWLYDGATTRDVGLIGPEHTRSGGYKYSDAEALNEAGQVSGYSKRYNGGNLQKGQDAWFYDPLLDQTFALQLSTSSDGYAYSSASYLGEDGLVLGTYRLFDALNNDLGDRAFYFTIADGLHDLGFFVDDGLAANGWDYLASAIRANSRGQIIGYGILTSPRGAPMAYLLTPAVPEPSTCLLAALSFAGLLLPRRAVGRNRTLARAG